MAVFPDLPAENIDPWYLPLSATFQDVKTYIDEGDAASGTLFPVTLYGAVGDGVANDAAAINSAASAASAFGGSVYFESGKTFAVSTPVNLLSNVKYRGDGLSSVIKAKAPFTGNAVMDYGAGGRTGVVIESLTIDGNKASTSGSINGINNPVSDSCTIRNVMVKNTRTRGIHLYQSADATIENVRIVDCGTGNDGDTGTYVGLAVEGDNHTIRDVRVIRPSGMGIVVTGASDNIQMDNCRVVDAQYIGIGFGGSNITNPTISNCIVVGSVTGPGIDTGNAYHSTVTGCNVNDSWAGFVSDSGRWQTFTGCHVNKPTTLHGFDITASPDSTLSGCSVFIGDSGVGRGFQIVSSPRTVATGCSVNEPHPDWEAFQVFSSDNVTLSACRVSDGRVSPADTVAFQIAGTSSNCLVTDVDVSGLSAANLYQDTSSGSGNIARLVGSGTPESVIAADVGSTFTRRDGSGSTLRYAKATGTGNTGWSAVGP